MPTDRYQQLTALPPGRFIAKRLGLPESRPGPERAAKA